jgi:hypothetical protein
MIASGINGLSRGDKLEGIAMGANMKTFISIHLDPVTRSTNLLDWVYSWWPSNDYGDLHMMTVENWFDCSMSPGNFLW